MPVLEGIADARLHAARQSVVLPSANTAAMSTAECSGDAVALGFAFRAALTHFVRAVSMMSGGRAQAQLAHGGRNFASCSAVLLN